MTVDPQAQRAACERLHQKLPKHLDANPAIQLDQSLAEIRKAAGLPEWDNGSAQAYRTMLVSAGALIERRNDQGIVVAYKKGPFPEPVSLGGAVERENALLAKLHAEEQGRIEHELKAAKAAQDVLNASSRAAEEREFLRKLDEAGLSPEEIRHIVAVEVEAAIDRHLAATV